MFSDAEVFNILEMTEHSLKKYILSSLYCVSLKLWILYYNKVVILMKLG